MSDALTVLKTTLADRYEVLHEIGAGGMATVYLARDKRHDRPVALKVLNPELGAVLGVERFLAEIKVTANLQHPNLLPLFDSGEAGGHLFYVMPYVEGESLRAKLQREKQLPIDEAIRITVAVAEALDYAHSHHVIHRDLKPENILIQHGQPVVADFGIALAVSNAGGHRITQTGLSLGTPQYMSPEQATGDRLIDGRSDIYSLGAVAYEMLTGDPPHTGSTAQAVIARVLTDKPRSIRSSRSSVPEHVEHAIEHALEKLPADRFHSAKEFSEAIQGHGTSAITSAGVSRRATARPWRDRLRDPVVLALGALLVATAAATPVMVKREKSDVPAPVVRFVLNTSDSARPVSRPPWPAAISPDGGTIVYYARRPDGKTVLFARQTDQLGGHELPGTDEPAEVSFSPDGQWVEYESAGTERKVRLDGSAPITIGPGGASNGADWTVHDVILIGSMRATHGITVVSAGGGDLREITHPDSAHGEQDHLWPISTPDGNAMAFVIWSGSLQTSELAMAKLSDGKVVRLGVKGIRPLAFLDKHIVYVTAEGNVMAAPVNLRSFKITESPIPVLDPVSVVGGNNGNSGIYIARSGALVTSIGSSRAQLTWFTRGGTPAVLTAEPRAFSNPRLSPDGRRIAIEVSNQSAADVWIYDIATQALTRLSSAPIAYSPSWTSDGTHIVYCTIDATGHPAVVEQAADGGSPPVVLISLTTSPTSAEISSDGHWLVLDAFTNNTFDVYKVALSTGAKVEPYIGTSAQEFTPRLSPDAHWVALSSTESGENEVYIRSFPDPSIRLQVSTTIGTEPAWSRDGRTLYYRQGPKLIAASLAYSPLRVVSVDTSMAAFGGIASRLTSTNFDVSPDDRRVLGLTMNQSGLQLVAVPNWLTEFRQRIAAAARK